MLIDMKFFRGPSDESDRRAEEAAANSARRLGYTMRLREADFPRFRAAMSCTMPCVLFRRDSVTGRMAAFRMNFS